MLYMSPVPKTSTDSRSLTKGSTLYVCFSKQKILKKKNKKFTYKILEIFNVKQIKAPGLLQSVWGTFLGKGVKRGRGFLQLLTMHQSCTQSRNLLQEKPQLPAYSPALSLSLPLIVLLSLMLLQLSLSILHSWAGDFVCVSVKCINIYIVYMYRYSCIALYIWLD